MSKAIFLAAVIGIGVFLFNKCSVKSSADVAFTGTWMITNESEISGKKETSTSEVITDGKRFRIRNTSIDPFYNTTTEHTTVYDGQFIYEQSTYSGGESGTTSSPARAEAIAPEKAARLRFWSTIESGLAEGGPGGRVAGRETILFQMRENRPDATATIQRWLDAENKTMLKSSISLYAKQVESMLSKDTYECQSIKFGPVQESAFTKP